MGINDDFLDKAEAEMRLNDAKMMEQAMIRKLKNAPAKERISFALTKTGNDAEMAFAYLNDNYLILDDEKLSLEDVKDILEKK